MQGKNWLTFFFEVFFIVCLFGGAGAGRGLRFGCAGILVPPPGIKPVPCAMEARSLNYWIAREVPKAG